MILPTVCSCYVQVRPPNPLAKNPLPAGFRARFAGGAIARRGPPCLGRRAGRACGICPKARWTSFFAGAKISAGKQGEPPDDETDGGRVMGPLYTFEGKTPVVHPRAWVAPTAAVIGDVEIAEEASIWYHCVLRGDTNIIRIGPRTNIQDGTIVHVNAGRQSTIIGADVTVGHAAIIHACRLEDRAFVGMGATVLDDAVIEAGGVLAAGFRNLVKACHAG